MPDPLPRRSNWMFLTPWKHPTPWARFVGCFCNSFTVLVIVAWVMGGWLVNVVAVLTLALPVIFVIDMVKYWRSSRKYKKTLRTLRAWAKVIDGKVKIEDLPPGQQEDIAVQRAIVRVEEQDPRA